jgi:thiol:disulfide interchange protein DsbD
MKKIVLLLVIFFTQFTQAQLLDPVKWTQKIEKISDTEYNLVCNGTIDKDWHMYSQYTPDGGALPLEVLYDNAKGNYEPVGKAKESAYKKHFNEVFGVDEYYFETKVKIQQRIKIINLNLTQVVIKLNYQACKESCINQEKTFTFVLPKTASATAIVEQDSLVPDTEAVAQTPIANTKPEPKETAVVPTETNTDKGWLTIFILAFLGGFAALLTPCVFPMIPMTVSFFTKQSKNKAEGKRNAILYGISIIIIYVILGSLVTAVFGSDALNALSTNIWFNLIFFFLLIFFAASFLGAFEIVLPNSWANKVDRQADRGGFIGILFMALALAIVSFSCTGPIIGTLLVEAASKGGLAPIVGMVGFSLALALPFMLFAMFPGWMNSLPKSGGWLNTVKVSLGFLELALAFKFLSKADLVTQSHLLPREIFLAIWIAVFGAWAMYLFGKITLPHDSQLSYISVGRLFMALIVTSFTFYLIPGLWGAPLKVLSGFPPPLYYSESPEGFGGSSIQTDSAEKQPEHTKKISHGLITFLDYEAGIAYAKKMKKPVLLDFTGHGCENCRKMEDFVWSNKEVLNILKNDLVIISLYVDEKKELPENEKYVSKQTGKEIKTVGNKWSDFQITRYQTNTQPQYLILDTEGKTISDGSTSYDPDVTKYESWLKKGISNFK